MCVCVCGVCVQRFAQHTLQCLLSEHPSFLQTEGDMRMCLCVWGNFIYTCVVCVEVATEWTEDSVKTCVVVYLALLPLNPKLLKE